MKTINWRIPGKFFWRKCTDVEQLHFVAELNRMTVVLKDKFVEIPKWTEMESIVSKDLLVLKEIPK